MYPHGIVLRLRAQATVGTTIGVKVNFFFFFQLLFSVVLLSGSFCLFAFYEIHIGVAFPYHPTAAVAGSLRIVEDASPTRYRFMCGSCVPGIA